MDDTLHPSGKPRPPVEATGPKRGTETILFVEDEEPLRNVITDFLGEFGYRVLSAESGPEALALAAGFSGDIHLLLTDVTLAPITGPELARQIGATRPKMKVVYISGYATGTPDSSQDAVLVQKPFSIKVLSARIRETLEQTG
jgi:two-component system cell cycle sensor histidine kinase/response regulator CckA